MITVADTMRWLHQDGLRRLASFGSRLTDPIAAYTVDVGTGAVAAHPAAGVGLGSDVLTVAADQLPEPVGTSGRLVVVGITDEDEVLVVDLAMTLAIAINSDEPDRPARSWAMQLLLNPNLTLTTNSSDSAIGDSARYRHRFIPSGGTLIIIIDDLRTPVTTVRFNPPGVEPDHLDIYDDDTGELNLGARTWQLRKVIGIDDAAWSALRKTLEAQAGASPVENRVLAPGDVR